MSYDESIKTIDAAMAEIDNLRAKLATAEAITGGVRATMQAAQAERDSLRQQLTNLIAVIDRDGGHAQTRDIAVDVARATTVVCDTRQQVIRCADAGENGAYASSK